MPSVTPEELRELNRVAMTIQILESELNCERARMNKALIETLHEYGRLAGMSEIDQVTGEIRDRGQSVPA